MLNVRNTLPLTRAELFLLMRLLQHLENTGELPVEANVDKETWQTIYSKLNYTCLQANHNGPAQTSPTTPG